MIAPPTIPARRVSNGRQLEITCPGCGRAHRHGRHNPNTTCQARTSGSNRCTCPTGTGDGHRLSHCDQTTGYILKEN